MHDPRFTITIVFSRHVNCGEWKKFYSLVASGLRKEQLKSLRELRCTWPMHTLHAVFLLDHAPPTNKVDHNSFPAEITS